MAREALGVDGGRGDDHFQIGPARQKLLEGQARAKGVTVIPDCGLAPGMVNILAQMGISRCDRTESVRIYVGGLPQHPEGVLKYQVVYSLEGVLDYYTTLCWVVRGGKRVNIEALSEIEPVEFASPVGTLEAFHTAGGLSTMAYRYEGKIPTMEYKTLRYPGHAQLIRTAVERARAPDQHALADEAADGVDGLALRGDVEVLLLLGRDRHRRRARTA